MLYGENKPDTFKKIVGNYKIILNFIKKVKLVIGLTFCLGALFSIETLKQNTVANVGWGLCKICNSGEGVTVVTGAVAGGVGAYAGAKVGASIGWLGGPAGAVVGGAVGAL